MFTSYKSNPKLNCIICVYFISIQHDGTTHQWQYSRSLIGHHDVTPLYNLNHNWPIKDCRTLQPTRYLQYTKHDCWRLSCPSQVLQCSRYTDCSLVWDNLSITIPPCLATCGTAPTYVIMPPITPPPWTHGTFTIKFYFFHSMHAASIFLSCTISYIGNATITCVFCLLLYQRSNVHNSFGKWLNCDANCWVVL